MNRDAVPVKSLLAYGGLRMPLAIAELPLFVLLPNFYGGVLGLDLAAVGLILLMTRGADAIIDPAIGTWIDGSNARDHYRRFIWIALPALMIGYLALLWPLPQSQGGLAAWLAAGSMLTYLGYSIVSIAYQAWGAAIAHTDAQRVRVTGVREGFGLVGVLMAAAFLTPEGIPVLSVLFVVLAIPAAVALLKAPTLNGRDKAAPATPLTSGLRSLWAAWLTSWPNRRFRWLLGAMISNGVATAVPATLVLFFVADVLEAAEMAPAFLFAYFLAGAIGMPIWIKLASLLGLRQAWLAGMGCAIIAFVWALGLGAGDTSSFLIICVLTGFALGADLALPPALLSAVIAAHGHSGRHEGAYFGIWNLSTKLCLAIAAGVALPLVSLLGYVPGATDVDPLALSLVYAALPCLLKLLAALIVLLDPSSRSDQRALDPSRSFN